MAANKDESDLERLRILVSDGKGHRLEEITHTVTRARGRGPLDPR
jgi:hypothetical protein